MTPHFEFVGHDEGYFERRGAAKEEIGFVLATGEVSETYSERYIAKGVLTGGYERPKGFYYPHKELQVVYSIEEWGIAVITVIVRFGFWKEAQ